jgi:lipopolysaccharide/colanic/teichoic acid biosynthesis glycosyltransferase
MGTYIFRQVRVGKDGKPFLMFKLRTMRLGADEEKGKYLKFNEADGPVFKIKNDPRYTRLGKLLAYTGIDELPQIVNVLKGEMSLVGPRPLPVDEERKIALKWRIKRKSVKPGITSSWAIGGAHRLPFPQWMELDMQDINNKSSFYDAMIIVKTFRLLITNVFIALFNLRHYLRIF